YGLVNQSWTLDSASRFLRRYCGDGDGSVAKTPIPGWPAALDGHARMGTESLVRLAEVRRTDNGIRSVRALWHRTPDRRGIPDAIDRDCFEIPSRRNCRHALRRKV